VRDGLSLLDQALAMGSGTVAAANVRAMLGLADRARIFDLLERLLAGTAGEALQMFAGLHRDGAEPLQILGDLAEAVHIATRAKVLGAEAAGEGLSAEERRRAADLGARLSMPILARGWQVLLKGLEEAAEAPNASAAAEMVLVRLAFTADLPPPEEILKALGGGTVTRAQPAGRASTPAPAAAPAMQQAATAAAQADPVPATVRVVERVEAAPDEPDGEDDSGLDIDGETSLQVVRSFAEVVDLVGTYREVKLKVDLEERVSLVRFDPAGSIDLFLLPGAPKELANELREKLNLWTGTRWVVALSNKPGERPLGEVQREREAAELREIQSHPAVAAVLQQFPDAKLKLKPLPGSKG
jgi:DNA polymerase-3 subunit gamma/tau